MSFELIERPGYFGRRRDEKVAKLNETHGKDNWTLVWAAGGVNPPLEFEDACILYYEQSYLKWFNEHEADIDFIASNYKECIDNAPTNVQSGVDYTKQEAFSTHIQDIALRNVMFLMGRRFNPDAAEVLVIRSADSTGYKYGPGNIPFFAPGLITQPSLAPRWAQPGSCEDFWQSNKWVALIK